MPGTDERTGLVVHHLSVHGLIRGHDLELGRDADTGGQTKYVVELARALGRHEAVREAVLFTRRIDDPRVSDDYAREEEPLGEGARIVRVHAGGDRYRRKERLWPHLDTFARSMLTWYRATGERPDLLHGHYADAGDVARELAAVLGVPLIVTGHSLGRNKIDVLRAAGVDDEAIESRYRIAHRIEVEERLLRDADRVVASTEHEVEHGYERYEAAPNARFEVIPPGVDLNRFYPWFYDQDGGYDPGEKVVEARVRMMRALDRFLTDVDKPLILAISRPDKRKNIVGLLTAYGEDPELRSLANLAVFAGVRKDIEAMSDNEREVLTELLLAMDRYDLYGKLALPKKHDPDTDIPVLYRLAAASRGVFVNPALVENFGITLIEASASGLPVVSTDHGGPKDIIGRCGSGELIDARDTEAIQEALRSVLVDEEAWDRYSRAGVEGVRAHYSWTAHVARYLEVVEPLLGEDRPDLGDWRTDAGRTLLDADALLISDVDGTLVDGAPDADALEDLAAALAEANVAFGLASGRRLERVEEAIAGFGLPQPSVIVSDVGSDIHYGRARVPDRGWRAHVARGWDREAVDELVRSFGVAPQEQEAQSAFKASYLLDDPKVAQRIEDAVKERGLAASVVFSHGAYLDLLPARAGKGRAVRWLADLWGFDRTRVATAGDSGNDADMLRGRFRGIVVGNHAPELRRIRGRRNVLFVEAPHARGVLEGLRRHGLVPDG